jgi:hypothetical protein
VPPRGLPPLPALRLATQLAAGMAYVHARGILHRDLKSPNLLLDVSRTHLKICDFGMARFQGGSNQSMTGELGTYRWMAPELLEHRRYDAAVDVYSFAVVLWEMATGRVPYEELSAVVAATAVATRQLRPALGGVPSALAAVMRACWRGEPGARPAFRLLEPALTALRDEEAAAAGAVAREPTWLGTALAEDEPPGSRRGGSEDGRLRIIADAAARTPPAEAHEQRALPWLRTRRAGGGGAHGCFGGCFGGAAEPSPRASAASGADL